MHLYIMRKNYIIFFYSKSFICFKIFAEKNRVCSSHAAERIMLLGFLYIGKGNLCSILYKSQLNKSWQTARVLAPILYIDTSE